VTYLDNVDQVIEGGPAASGWKIHEVWDIRCARKAGKSTRCSPSNMVDMESLSSPLASPDIFDAIRFKAP
jgi:hypothetical protein